MKKYMLLAVGLVIGTTMFAQFRLDVVGDAKIQGTLELTKEEGDSSIFIGINAGSIDDGNNENTFIGADAGKFNIRGHSNTFVGYKAGRHNDTNTRNSIFGHYAGKESEGWSNCFFGESSGANNNGAFNAFFGAESGLNSINWNNSFFGYKTGKNSSGGYNAFMGAEAGKRNEGAYNSFFGYNAGKDSNGDNNAFFGREAGIRNEGSQNSFFGYRAGYWNNIGANNIFIGNEAGRNETAHFNSTFIGANAGSNADSLHQAIAIGHNANVSCDNCAAIGGYGENAVKLGIGTGYPRAPLHILKSYNYHSYNKDYVAIFEDTTSAYIATLTDKEHSSGIIFKQSRFGLSGGLFYNTEDNPDGLIIRNNDRNNLLLTAEGNVGIGVTNPVTKLHLMGVGDNNNLRYKRNSVAIFENDEDAYLSIFGEDEHEKGLVFGQPSSSAAGGILYNTSDNPDGLSFRSHGGNFMALTKFGALGVGTISPDTRLHIRSNADNDGTTAVLKITSNGQNMLLDGNEIDSDSDIHLNHNSDRHVYAVRGGGDMIIGGTRQNIDSRLQVQGHAAKSSGGGTWISFSDRRLKKDIRPYKDGLNELLRIKPVRYRYNGQFGTSTEQEEIGIIAQDMQKVAPYMVGEFEHEDEKGRKNNYLTYNPNALFYMLVNSVQSVHQHHLDQQKIIDTQAKTIQQLENKINNFEKRFAQLEQVINATGQPNNESINAIELKTTALLSQNQPNPFHEYTNIQYSIPNGVQNAMLRIADNNGKVLKEHFLNKVGEGQIQIKATHFPAGTYYYSLILDGQLFETKRMILAWK